MTDRSTNQQTDLKVHVHREVTLPISKCSFCFSTLFPLFNRFNTLAPLRLKRNLFFLFCKKTRFFILIVYVWPLVGDVTWHMRGTGCSLNIVFFPKKIVIFLNSASSAVALVFYFAWCVYTHWHRGKSEKGQSLEYSKVFGKKHNI